MLAGVQLWQRRPWGYLLGTVMLLFGTVYQLSYLAALAFQSSADVPGAGFDPAEPAILGVFVVGTVLLLTGLHTRTVHGPHPIPRPPRRPAPYPGVGPARSGHSAVSGGAGRTDGGSEGR